MARRVSKTRFWWLVLLVLIATSVGLWSGWVATSNARLAAPLEQPDEITCPTAGTVEFEVTLDLIVDGDDLRLRSRLEGRAKDVRPPESAPQFLSTIGPSSVEALNQCLIAGWWPFDLEELSWENGQLDFTLSRESPVTVRPDGTASARYGLDAWLEGETVHLSADLCGVREPGLPETLACGSQTTATVRLDMPSTLLPARLVPPPNRVSQSSPEGDGAAGGGLFGSFLDRPGEAEPRQLSFWWRPHDTPVHITGELSASRAISAKQRVQQALAGSRSWDATEQLRVYFNWLSAINWQSELLLVVFGVVMIHWVSGRWAAWTIGLGLLLAAAGFLVLRPISTAATYPEPAPVRGVDEALVIGITWAMVALLLGERPTVRRRVLGCVVFLALLLGGRRLVSSGQLPDWAGVGVLVAGLIGMTVLGAGTAGSRLGQVSRLLPGMEARAWPSWRTVRAAVAACIVVFALAYLAGQAIGVRALFRDDQFLGLLTQGISSQSEAVGRAMVNLAPLLVAGVLASYLAAARSPGSPGAERTDLVTPSRAICWALAFVVAVAVEVRDVPLLSLISLPMWLLVVAMIVLITRHPRPLEVDAETQHAASLDAALSAESALSKADELDRKLNDGKASFKEYLKARADHKAQHPTDRAAAYLANGPSRAWWTNGQEAARIGMKLAVVPIAYYIWGALQALPQPSGAEFVLLYFLIGLIVEAFRWLGISFVFGALYRVLPGRVGPSKAGMLALAWLVATLGAELVSRWVGQPESRLWLYDFLQLAVFLSLLGVLYDWRSVREGGGTWRRLLDLYRVRNNRDLVAYVAPLSAAVVGLIQQVLAGAGVDAIEAFFQGLPQL